MIYDHDTLEALWGSVEKWLLICNGEGKNEGRNNCPLCQLFNSRGPYCVGCPVFIDTDKRGCDGTPYEEYDKYEECYPTESAVLQDLAVQEYEYLVDLALRSTTR